MNFFKYSFLFIVTIQSFLAAGSNIITYIHPSPGSSLVTPETTLLLKIDRSEDGYSASSLDISVNGDISGDHRCRIKLSGNTFIIDPVTDFAVGENVNVAFSFQNGNSHVNKSYSFRTADIGIPSANMRSCPVTEKQVNDPETHFSNHHSKAPRIIGDVTVPLGFPEFAPTINKEGAAPGKIFISNYFGAHYIMILENDGTPYYYRRFEDTAREFKVQPTGELTIQYGVEDPVFYKMDSTYVITDTLRCGNGYGTDHHEIFMTEDGHYFLIALGYRTVDMSKLVEDGKPNAKVIDNHIQEFDAEGNIIFEWLSNEHIDITDAVNYDLTQSTIDYMHVNSIAVDYDDNIIISSRHMSEITKINRETGEVMWRFGGKRSDFNLVNDDYGISFQHFARPVKGKPGSYTLFDNGNFHQPRFSRAVEYSLDSETHTARMTWQYKNTTLYAKAMGSAQRLPNGNTFINYSYDGLPKALEVTPEKEVVYNGDFVEDNLVYRSFRFEWEGVASETYLVAESYADKVRLVFNKFGDETVENYIIYAGAEEDGLIPVDTVKDTYKDFYDLENHTDYFFRVDAVSASSLPGIASDVKRVTTNYTEPGENIIVNGDFSDGEKNWELVTGDQVLADSRVTSSSEAKITVDYSGQDIYKVVYRQTGIPLIKGKEYNFSFTLRSSVETIFDVKLENEDGTVNYSRTGTQIGEREDKKYSFDFTMEDLTDYEAVLSFYLGSDNTEFFLNDISLVEKVETGVEDKNNPASYALRPNYPNPFNPETVISYSLAERSRVSLNVYSVTGELVASLVNSSKSAGENKITFNAAGLSSGVYIYRLNIIPETDSPAKTFTRKMLYLK